MIIKENDNMVSVHFDDMISLMDFVPGNSINKKQFDVFINDRKTQHGEGSDWAGDTHYYQIVEKALLGDSRAYEIAVSRMKTLGTGKISSESQSIRAVRRRKIKGSTGDEVDIHKVYQGILDKAWTRTVKEEIDAKHHLVTLFLMIGGNSEVKFMDTIWRCSVLLKLVEEIQRAGKSVQVIVGACLSSAMKENRKLLTVSINVKKYNESLTPERLAAMSNIGFYRTFGFAAKRCQQSTIAVSDGYPKPIGPDNMPIHLSEEVDKGFTKPVFLSGVENKHSAEAEIKNAYRQMASFK